MKSEMLLESPIFTVEAALKASKTGINRLELCSSYAEGGETPGVGMLSYLKKRITLPIFVMIRPRGGDFNYNDDEIEVMKEEIHLLKSYGADGFVFGVLKPDRSLNMEMCRLLIDQADEKPCTLHRAFDVSSDLSMTLEDAIDCGFKRILTSGGAANVGDGLEKIIQLLDQAGDRIIVMPGGGMKPEYVKPLSETGYLREIHSSCKKVRSFDYGKNQSGAKLNLRSDIPDGVLTIDPEIVAHFNHVMK